MAKGLKTLLNHVSHQDDHMIMFWIVHEAQGLFTDASVVDLFVRKKGCAHASFHECLYFWQYLKCLEFKIPWCTEIPIVLIVSVLKTVNL